ncbi:hypothetical protein KUCAC02_030594 [Chaenocephalus aceratus]|uniref:Uncharacterized protein n=1 Tax=Chaenocephalus aceratus TaxID=36190 RepID=A0ACB9XKD0_CHAAC|nr:hypothetical protein KUCAC02_030594 [Chaenocephalus aceratus]
MTWPHESSERDLRVPWLLCRLSSWSKQTSGQLILRRIPAAPGSSPGSASFSPLRTTMDRHYKWTAVLLPDPSAPLPEWLLTWLPRVVCNSSAGSHLGPPAGPAPEPKWKKNLRLLMKRRDQAGSRGSRRGAVDEGKPSPPVPEEGWSLVPCAHPTRIVLRRPQRSGSSSSSRSSSCFSCSSSPVLSCRPSPPVPEEGWSLVPCAHPTRIVLRRPQRSGSSPRPEPPREPLPVRKVPEQQWMKSARLLMKKRSQVGSRWRKRGAEAAGMSAGNGAAKRFCPST